MACYSDSFTFLPLLDEGDRDALFVLKKPLYPLCGERAGAQSWSRYCKENDNLFLLLGANADFSVAQPVP
jgi:hypothetical protein